MSKFRAAMIAALFILNGTNAMAQVPPLSSGQRHQRFLRFNSAIHKSGSPRFCAPAITMSSHLCDDGGGCALADEHFHLDAAVDTDDQVVSRDAGAGDSASPPREAARIR